MQMEGNDNESFSINLANNFSPPHVFNIESIIGISSDNGMPEQGHRQSLQGQGPSSRGQGQPGQGHGQLRQGHGQLSRGRSQPGQGRGQTGPFQGILGHGWGQMGQDEGQSGQIQGPSIQGWGNKGQGQLGEGHNQPGQGPSIQGWGNKGQGQLGEGHGEVIKGHNQPGQGPSIQGWGNKGQGQLGEGHGEAIKGHNQPGQGPSIQGWGNKGQGQLGEGHGEAIKGHNQPGQGPSIQGWGNKGQGQLGEGHGEAIKGHNQPGQGPSIQGWGNNGQGQLGEGHGEAIKGHNQPGKRPYHDRTKKPQLDRGQTQPKQGQRQPEQGQGLPGHVHGLLGQGRGQPNQALGQPRQFDVPLGKVQEPSGHTWGQQGQGQIGRGRDKPRQGRDEIGQVQQGQAQRTLLQAQAAKTTEQHQPWQSTLLLLDGQETKDYLSKTYNSVRWEMDKVSMWKVKVDCEFNKKDNAIREAQETIDTLRKSILEIQFENEHLSIKLQDTINIKKELMARVHATRESFDDLKGQFSSVQQALTRGEAEMENIEHVYSSLKEEMKTFAATFSNLNLKSQNDRTIALDKVDATVQKMGRAQQDFLNKLAIKERQVKETSELLESKNEELKTTAQKLQDSIENCVRLAEIKCDFQTRLEQAQEEIITLKLEINRCQEVECTLQAEIQSMESSFAEKEREYTASTMELQQSYDKLQQEHQNLHAIVQNLEKANEELTEAASQRCSEEAEIRSRLETNIREKNTEIDNLKIESDNNTAKHKETLEYLDTVKQERASFQETICRMEQQIAAMETLINESKSERNEMKAKECVLENNLNDALKTVHVLESELCKERKCNLDISNKVGKILLENEELFSRVTSQKNELNNIVEATKHNEDTLQFNVQKMESNITHLEEDLESVKVLHKAELEAHKKKHTNLVHKLDEAHCEKDSYENKIKDLVCEMDSLKQQHEQARNKAMAELADCMAQIKHLEEMKTQRISSEIEKVKINAEKIAQFKITEMTAMVEEYKRQCDKKLEDKEKDFYSLDQRYKEALDNVCTLNTANADEMRAEIAKLKEELKQKETNIDVSHQPEIAPQLAVTPRTFTVTPAKSNSNTLTPGSAEKTALRKSSRSSVGISIRVIQASPLPAPVTETKSASKGFLNPLDMGEIVNKKRKVDDQLLQSVTGVMSSKRPEKASAASKISKQSERDMSRHVYRINQKPSIFYTKQNKVIGISRKSTSTEKIKQGKMFSALPPITLPAKQLDTPFDCSESQDVYTFGPED
ncbi:uncharacterized protein LOC116956455 isoform X2 [Petromyzon marinus]|uniref:uncharacterized protein LOC116956455 isoform X2 n=1 Tax=Petromyzon marinus TaxID=7757 RepID=UPI003F71A6C8